jgi:hypothetical protein
MPCRRRQMALQSGTVAMLCVLVGVGCAPAAPATTPVVVESATAASLISKVCAKYAVATAYEDTGLLEETSPSESPVFPASVSPASTREAQFRTEFRRLDGRMLLDVQTTDLPMSTLGRYSVWTKAGSAHSWSQVGDRGCQSDNTTLYDGLASMAGVTSRISALVPYLLLGKDDEICSQTAAATLVGLEIVRGVRCSILRINSRGHFFDSYVDDSGVVHLIKMHVDSGPTDMVVFFDPHFPSDVEEDKFTFDPVLTSAPCSPSPDLRR